jgi:hypothetical protein
MNIFKGKRVFAKTQRLKMAWMPCPTGPAGMPAAIDP